MEVEGPAGVQLVDARPSDALNLATLVQAPIFVTPEVLQEAEARRTGDSPRSGASASGAGRAGDDDPAGGR